LGSCFEHFGIQVGLDEVWRQIGKGGDQLIPVFVPNADQEHLTTELETFRRQIFHRDYMPRVVSFAKSRELLVRVKTSGMKIALASSSDDADIAVYKRIVDMDDLVEQTASSDDAKESKPNPDIFAAALKKMGIQSHEAVALGDTPYDANAAGQIGIPVIGLTCGRWKRDDLLDAGCVEVYQDPADLLLHFDTSLLMGSSERS